jgi:acyl-CoA thioesterase-1
VKYFFVARIWSIAALFFFTAPVHAEVHAHAETHAQARERTQASTHTIIVLGDSLSAAYGIPRELGWVALLQEKLAQEKLIQEKQTRQNLPNVNVINAGISGDTSDGGLARLPALLEKYKPDIAIVELGANDGLRGFQIDRIRSNLERIIALCQKSNAKVLLIGIKMPPNYGARYTSDFYAMYTSLAKKLNVRFVPFLLEGVAAHAELMQADGLHPNADAQPNILNTVWTYLQPML